MDLILFLSPRSRGCCRPVLPCFDVFAVMVERQTVRVAEILVAVFAVERQVDPLAAESAGGVQGVLLLFEKTGEKSPDPANDSHGSYVLTSRVKNGLPQSPTGLLAQSTITMALFVS